MHRFCRLTIDRYLFARQDLLFATVATAEMLRIGRYVNLLAGPALDGQFLLLSTRIGPVRSSPSQSQLDHPTHTPTTTPPRPLPRPPSKAHCPPPAAWMEKNRERI